MGTLSVFSLYTLVLGLNGYLGAAAGRNLIRAMRSARESPFESFLEGARPDAVSQHMFKVYEKYNREVRHPQEGNTVRSFKGIQGELKLSMDSSPLCARDTSDTPP